ncbi:uncharacterized protein BDW70DRAFT_145496 [Aspergillus foveolatus]|uniref:uncharacterized protein n=1 Tax=Aspergillus foveolatus TaxID=210207 RepID=UPI003CCDCCC6
MNRWTKMGSSFLRAGRRHCLHLTILFTRLNGRGFLRTRSMGWCFNIIMRIKVWDYRLLSIGSDGMPCGGRMSGRFCEGFRR